MHRSPIHHKPHRNTLSLHSELRIAHTRMILTLSNNTSETIRDFKLCISIPLSDIDDTENLRVLHAHGSYLEIAPPEISPKKTLEHSAVLMPGTQWTCSFVLKIMHSISDAPRAPFLVTHSPHEQIIVIEDYHAVCTHTTNTPPHTQQKPHASRPSPTTPHTSIIPHPIHVTQEDGTLRTQKYCISPPHHDYTEVISSCNALFARLHTSLRLEILPETPETSQAPLPQHIAITIHPLLSSPHISSNKEEAYCMDVRTEGISIFTDTTQGLRHALVSLLHLHEAAPEYIRCTRIHDAPRFKWRGFMLDTVRRFYERDEILRILDIMALHKLNKFHWHMTDDENWRIALPQYPQLTEQGAHRGYGLPAPPWFGSGAHSYGGSYSHDDIRTIVAHAHSLGIDVLPELDIPGHSYSLIQGLKEQLIEQEDKSVYTSVQGLTQNTLNPALDTTYEVIQHILSECATLFPFEYIHYGFDEVPTGVWEQSPACQKLMKQKNLTSTKDLGAYFAQKVEQMIHAHKKKGCAWEEAGEIEGISPSTILFVWISADTGIRAAKKGIKVVMCPSKYYYFDMMQSPHVEEVGASWAGHAHVSDTYHFEPIPPEAEAYADNFLGVQSCLWSELIYDQARFEYMVFPRVAALAESAWTPRAKKDYQNFRSRVTQYYFPLLDKIGISYREEI